MDAGTLLLLLFLLPCALMVVMMLRGHGHGHGGHGAPVARDAQPGESCCDESKTEEARR